MRRALLLFVLVTAACPGPPRLLAPGGGGDAGPPPPLCPGDQDGDGFGPGCALGPDCDDTDEGVHTLLTFFPDDDGDGALTDKSVERCTDGTIPRGASFEVVTANVDCDDDDARRAPTLPEECDGLDNNCSGLADEDFTCPCEAIYDGDQPYLRCGPGTWEAACQLPGYSLVIVDDAAEQSFLAQVGGRFWIGLSDRALEDSFVWVDGTPLDFTAFAGGQPDNFADGEDCVDSSGNSWNDLPCDQVREALCEADPALFPVGGCVDGDGDLRGVGCERGPDCDDGDAEVWAVRGGWADEDEDGATAERATPLCVGDAFPAGFAPAPGAVDCDDQDPNDQNDCGGCAARYLDGQRYIFCDDRRTWSDARDRCRARSRELVTVDDAEENLFLAIEAELVAGGSWWIGLNDRQSEDNFEWVADGASISFDAFAPDEPNNQNGEDCVELGGSTWNDSDCNVTRRYICE